MRRTDRGENNPRNSLLWRPEQSPRPPSLKLHAGIATKGAITQLSALTQKMATRRMERMSKMARIASTQGSSRLGDHSIRYQLCPVHSKGVCWNIGML